MINYIKKYIYNIFFAFFLLFTFYFILNEVYGESNAKITNQTYPSKPINLILPYAAGSNTDIGAKALIPYVEKELGVPINIINKPGNGGWNGWIDLFEGSNDGYTIGYINTPTMLVGYMNPSNHRNFSFRDLDLIANHVLNVGAIAVRRTDRRFYNIKHLVEYAKSHEVTTTSASVGDAEHIAMLKFNQKHITNFVPVHMGGRIQGYKTALGGNIDVIIDNVGVLSRAQDNREVRVLAVMAPQRSSFLPNTPTVYESGFGSIHALSSRGIAAPKGVDPKKLEILRNAFSKAISKKEHIEEMRDLGYEVKLMTGKEYWNFLVEEEDAIRMIINILYFLS